MNNVMKAIVTVLLITIMGLGFYLVDWSDKYKEIKTLEDDYTQKIAQRDKLKEDVAKLQEYRDRATVLEKELQSLVQSKFTKEEPELFVANYIAEIERLVAQQQEVTGDWNFAIKSITPRGEKMSEVKSGGGDEEEASADNKGAKTEQASPAASSEALQGFPTRVFAMEMNGQYSTLVDFLYQLGNLKLDRLVTINEIKLRPGKTEEGTSPVLSITIPITAYLRQGSN